MTVDARALLDCSPLAVIVYDREGYIRQWNTEAERLFGWGEDEVIDRPHPWRTRSEEAQLTALLEYAFSSETAADLELTRSNKVGSTVVIHSFIAPLRNEAGEIWGMTEMVAVLGSRAPTDVGLQRITHHDPLTDLPTRLLYRQALERAIIETGREQSRFAVIHVDIASLKTVNHAMGYAAGDQVLLELSRRLTHRLADRDIAARIGGDEFAALLRNITSSAEVSAWAQQLLATLSRPMTVDGRDVCVQMCGGISLYPNDGEQASVLMQHADIALQRAKQLGRNRCEFYSEEIRESAGEKLWIEAALMRALENGELMLHYQPKVDIASGRVVGMEALARWRHPDRGMVPPAAFIPVAEEAGFIVPLGEWTARKASAQAKAWIDEGLPPLRVAVNLSVHQTKRQDVVAMIRQVLQETGLDPQYFEVEITESEIMRNADANIALLRALKDMGISISIDDFGTGYSSLSYLTRFPIDTVKIDMAFVRHITSNPENAAIASAIIALAHSLGMKVIAEGVETEGELGFLYQHNCDEIQGFYFSHPLPPEEFAQLLRHQRLLTLSEGLRKHGERTVLVVDDEEGIRSSLNRLLSRQGYSVLTAPDATTAFEVLATHRVGVIISDQQMPGMTGVEFLSHVKEMYPRTMRIVLTGRFEIEVVMEAINRGSIYKFIPKPSPSQDLLDAVRDAFRVQESRRLAESDAG